MTYLHSPIAKTSDPEFQLLINELYHCAGWGRDDGQHLTLFYLLSAINAEDPKALTAAHLPVPGVLTTKVGKLRRGVVYDLCVELVKLKPTHLEAFDGKTVLSLLKAAVPKPARRTKPSRRQARHENSTRVILQRRQNGDL